MLQFAYYQAEYFKHNEVIASIDRELDNNYTHEIWVRQQKLKAKRDYLGCLMASELPGGSLIGVVGAGITYLRRRKHGV